MFLLALYIVVTYVVNTGKGVEFLNMLKYNYQIIKIPSPQKDFYSASLQKNKGGICLLTNPHISFFHLEPN
jgi:hypothetical protein